MANQPGIKKSWSLLDFAKAKGYMDVGQFKNGETGEQYNACVFTNPTDEAKKTWVNFSSNLGSLSAEEIGSRYQKLQVVELEVAPEVAEKRRANGRQTESYVLCTVGDNSWQRVNLPI